MCVSVVSLILNLSHQGGDIIHERWELLGFKSLTSKLKRYIWPRMLQRNLYARQKIIGRLVSEVESEPGDFISALYASTSGQQIKFLVQGTHSCGPCKGTVNLCFLNPFFFFCFLFIFILMDACFSSAILKPFIKLYQPFWPVHHSFFLKWFWLFTISSLTDRF